MDDQPNPNAMWEINFIQQMKRLREAREMTQTDLAKALRTYGLPFHQQTIQRIENGERPVRLNEAYIISEALRTNLGEMVASADLLDYEMLFSVNRIRRDSGRSESSITVTITEWMRSVHYFLEVLSKHIERANTKELKEFDPVVQWGLAWAFKIDRTLSLLIKAVSELSRIQDSPITRRGDEETIDWSHVTLSNEIHRKLEYWRENFYNLDIERKSLMPSGELFTHFPGGLDSTVFADPPF